MPRAGGVVLLPGEGGWTGYSDIKLKTNIDPIKPCLNLINKLKPVSFNWKRNSEKTNYGFIAQEVETVIPELIDVCIDQTTQEEAKAIKTTDGLAPYLVKAIQEQYELFEEQQELINKMNNEIIELKNLVNNLIKLNNLIPQ